MIFRKDLEELEKQLIIPKVTIAVVGATGAGKSSLINAVVDQFSVLPTSGTQACTSVVVKIENNEDGEQYEADIEFLSREVCDYSAYTFVHVFYKFVYMGF